MRRFSNDTRFKIEFAFVVAADCVLLVWFGWEAAALYAMAVQSGYVLGRAASRKEASDAR